MISTIAAVSTRHAADGEQLSLPRLYVLRAIYLVIGVLEGAQVVPLLIVHDPAARGVIPALLSAFCLLCLLGVRYPRQMLPLLLFELIWKFLWTFAFGLPQYMSGQMAPTWKEDFKAIAIGVVIMPLVIPWPYVWHHYVKQLGDRWR
jgi:hypothetical protein